MVPAWFDIRNRFGIGHAYSDMASNRTGFGPGETDCTCNCLGKHQLQLGPGSRSGCGRNPHCNSRRLGCLRSECSFICRCVTRPDLVEA